VTKTDTKIDVVFTTELTGDKDVFATSNIEYTISSLLLAEQYTMPGDETFVATTAVVGVVEITRGAKNVGYNTSCFKLIFRIIEEKACV
jgi:hypothetical protein